MAYISLRVDFSTNDECNFCGNRLRSGKVRILVDDEGREVQAGPVCAKNNSVNPKEKIPDLTAAAFEGDEPELTRGGPGGQATAAASVIGEVSRGATNKEEIQRRMAECYLLLRVEKLGDFRDMKFERLVTLAEKLRGAVLADGDYRYLNNLMAKVQTVRPEVSIKNLQAIYACNYWINYFLAKESSDFISDLKRSLHRDLALTPGQVEALNKWFKNRPGMLSIKPDAFAFNPAERRKQSKQSE
ncbi:hypothetical protein BLL42_28090 (plasmid) [Pseudomonas frederiksbergensis]|uniref:Uncharacterized protein n=1 Tax=Pseudomonas frederiksbergensis TaxID=104087 RepID=A0A1J0EUT7_9PSED|nr:hypothetical protein [Pseudomonas frederiksbergensis]APC19576.1 hypothetical protein BLL42_28090 [Pseudomonas frederiksbergensis]